MSALHYLLLLLFTLSRTHALTNTHFPSFSFLYWTFFFFLHCHFFLFFPPGFSLSNCQISWASSCSNTDCAARAERVHSFDFESVWRYILICVVNVYMCLWCSRYFETCYIFHDHDIIFSAFSPACACMILGVWSKHGRNCPVMCKQRRRTHRWCPSDRKT